MKVVCWLIILAGIALACESQDSQRPLENDLAVSGQVAKTCSYNPKADYNPALNPVDHQIDNYGRSFKDFCLWFTIANHGRRNLVFDVVNAVWIFDDGFFASSITAAGGKSFVIPPGGKRQFSVSTADTAKEFFAHGNEHACFCFTLTALKNNRQDFGPFVSDNFPPLINLAACDEQEIGVELPEIKYFSLKFFLAADDFISDNLKKLQRRK